MNNGRIVVYWIPVGAGGNGTVAHSAGMYERLQARKEQRPTTTLLHTALEVHIDDARTVVECAWPSPDRFQERRGVVAEGPVFARWLRRFRPFRYEVRCWPEGCIADRDHATDVRLVAEDLETADRVLKLVASVPTLIWGRDEQHAGEMWNSNSVIAFALAGAGIDISAVASTVDGRAPGLSAGVVAAEKIRPRPQAPVIRDQ